MSSSVSGYQFSSTVSPHQMSKSWSQEYYNNAFSSEWAEIQKALYRQAKKKTKAFWEKAALQFNLE